MVAAGLRQIPACDDAQFNAEMLEQDRHEVGDHDDGEERVAKFSPPRQIGRPVTWVHITDRDEKSGTGESEQLPQKRCIWWNEDTTMNFRERNGCGVSAPSLFGRGQFRHGLAS